MLKYIRYVLGLPLLGFGVAMFGWTILLMTVPSLFASDAESLRLLKLGTVEMLTTLPGFLGLLDMLMWPFISGICGYFLFRPPYATLDKIQQAYRAGVARNEINRAWHKNHTGLDSSRPKQSFLGRAIMLGGTLLLAYALMMDTSVESGYGRVANIGLMADRQNDIILGCFAIVIGLILTLFQQRK